MKAGCTTFCFDIRPGCRQLPSSRGNTTARCTRFNDLARFTLLSGNDTFRVSGGSAITDPLIVFLGTGNDSAFGSETSNDTINDGSAGDDLVAGAFGNDTLSLGPGADVATGEDGSDRFQLGTPVKDERDDVNGGIGGDSATYSAPVGRDLGLRIIEANLETLAGERDAGKNDVLRSIESYAAAWAGTSSPASSPRTSRRTRARAATTSSSAPAPRTRSSAARVATRSTATPGATPSTARPARARPASRIRSWTAATAPRTRRSSTTPTTRRPRAAGSSSARTSAKARTSCPPCRSARGWRTARSASGCGAPGP